MVSRSITKHTSCTRLSYLGFDGRDRIRFTRLPQDHFQCVCVFVCVRAFVCVSVPVCVSRSCYVHVCMCVCACAYRGCECARVCCVWWAESRDNCPFATQPVRVSARIQFVAGTSTILLRLANAQIGYVVWHSTPSSINLSLRGDAIYSQEIDRSQTPRCPSGQKWNPVESRCLKLPLFSSTVNYPFFCPLCTARKTPMRRRSGCARMPCPVCQVWDDRAVHNNRGNACHVMTTICCAYA
jgi:hypothetical protein